MYKLDPNPKKKNLDDWGCERLKWCVNLKEKATETDNDC